MSPKKKKPKRKKPSLNKRRFLKSLLSLATILILAKLGFALPYLDHQVLIRYRSQVTGLANTITSGTTTIAGLPIQSLKLIQNVQNNQPNLPTGLVQAPTQEAIYQVNLLSDTTVTAAIQILANRTGVITVQPNYLYQPLDVPNDPYLTIPHNHDTSQYQYSTYLVDLPSAWAVTTGNRNVLIAIIDSGADATHPELATQLSSDSIDINTMSSNIKDGFMSNGSIHTHGTHVAGIIAGKGNNGQGIAGAAYGCKILMIKAIDDNTGSFSTSALLNALAYAGQKGAKVINMSLGGTTSGIDDILFRNQVTAEINAGISVVAAAGNDHTDLNAENMAPAVYPGVIAVSAADSSGNFDSSYSNYGAAVSIMAPGTGILSTIPTQSYGLKTGTSMATPMVSGVLGLMAAYAPNATRAQLYTALTASATDKGTTGRDVQTGYGLVNAFQALRYLDTTPPTIVHTHIPTANSLSPTIIRATITDNFPVAPSASVRYREYISSTPVSDWITTPMSASGSTYSATLALTRSDITDLSYYIIAQDAVNTTLLPTTGASTPFTVVYRDLSGPSISSTLKNGDFVSPQQNLTFNVTDNVGVNASSIIVTVTPTAGSPSSYLPGETAFSYHAPTLTIFPSGGDFVMPSGTFTLSITATDTNGNTSATAWTLSNVTVLNLFGPQGAGSPILCKPNPFNPRTETAKICYEITTDATTDIRIYDLGLHQIKQFSLTDTAGYKEVPWTGQDEAGSPVPSGIYIAIIKATANGKTLTQKVKIAVLKR